MSSISSGAIKYTSNNPSVATVDVNTGVVTPVGPGRATIVASQESTAYYDGATASYTVTVSSSDQAPTVSVFVTRNIIAEMPLVVVPVANKSSGNTADVHVSHLDASAVVEAVIPVSSIILPIVDKSASTSAAETTAKTGGGGVQISTATNGFISVRPMSDITVEKDNYFTYKVPDDVFIHSNSSMKIQYDARLQSGEPLPAWVTFNKGQKLLTGKPPSDAPDVLYIRVSAKDLLGNAAHSEIALKLT